MGARAVPGAPPMSAGARTAEDRTAAGPLTARREPGPGPWSGRGRVPKAEVERGLGLGSEQEPGPASEAGAARTPGAAAAAAYPRRFPPRGSRGGPAAGAAIRCRCRRVRRRVRRRTCCPVPADADPGPTDVQDRGNRRSPAEVSRHWGCTAGVAARPTAAPAAPAAAAVASAAPAAAAAAPTRPWAVAPLSRRDRAPGLPSACRAHPGRPYQAHPGRPYRPCPRPPCPYPPRPRPSRSGRRACPPKRRRDRCPVRTLRTTGSTSRRRLASAPADSCPYLRPRQGYENGAPGNIQVRRAAPPPTGRTPGERHRSSAGRCAATRAAHIALPSNPGQITPKGHMTGVCCCCDGATLAECRTEQR